MKRLSPLVLVLFFYACSAIVNKQINATAEEVSLYQFQPQDTLLDLGCGTGEFARNVGYTYPNMYFVLEDVHPTYLKRVDELFHTPGFGNKMKGRYRLVQGRQDSIPLPTGQRSLVLCRKSYHEFKNPSKMVAEMGRITRPGARLLITEAEPQYNGHRDRGCALPYLPADSIVKQVIRTGLFALHQVRRFNLYQHLPDEGPFHILEFRRTAKPAID